MTSTVQLFDPAMCCSTGVCGPDPDPALAQIAADLEWLRAQGVAVARYNLSQEPAAFARNAVVRTRLQTEGIAVLPLVLVNGELAFTGSYPSRTELAARAGLATSG
jgi:hypothetical protein